MEKQPSKRRVCKALIVPEVKTMITTHRTLAAVIAMIMLIFAAPLASMASDEDVYFDPRASLKEIAALNDVKVGHLKRELQLPANTRGKARMSELGVNKDQVVTAVTRLRGNGIPHDLAAAQMLMAVISIAAVFLLVRKKMSHRPKFLLLAAVVLVIGFGLGKELNPMTALVKVFKGLYGPEGNLGIRLAALFVFSLLAIIGTKAVCGWACPFGALQEFLHKIPLVTTWKKSNKIPCWLTNTVRIVLFVFFLCDISFGLTHLKGMGRVIYHYVNPFNLFEWHFITLSAGLYVVATILLSFFIYRPHCHFVCPFGLYSWFLERISIFRIRINREKCTDCKACVKACPGLAMKGIYEASTLPPDCFSCGECLAACTFDALSYSRSKRPAA
jgi:ferredoxin